MEWFLKWKMEWLCLVDGIIGVLSFGLIHTNFKMEGARSLTRWRSKRDGYIK